MQNKMSDNDTERDRHSEKQNEPTKERVARVRLCGISFGYYWKITHCVS